MIDNYFRPGTVIQAGYPIEMRYVGPREALLACADPAELRLSVRCPSHLRSALARRAHLQAAEDRHHLLLPQVLRHGEGQDLPARSEGAHLDLRHAAARRARPSSAGR